MFNMCITLSELVINCYIHPGALYLELRLSHGCPPDTQFANVKSKLITLGSLYFKSERFFPVSYLALLLEQHACERRWGPASCVQRLLRDMGVATVTLFQLYDKMFKAKVSQA